MTFVAKKRWGQHFLVDPNILRKIEHCIAPDKDDIIIEIGPGQGALTEYLVRSGAVVHAVEIDPALATALREKYASCERFHLWHQDALNVDLTQINGHQNMLRVVGNIPYNITSPLLFKLFNNHDLVRDVYFLIQKELALRIVAPPGCKEYGILSVMTRFYAEPKVEFQVSPHVFRPEPRVTSSLIHLVMKPPGCRPEFQTQLRTVVRQAFNQRRKTLQNALRPILPGGSNACPIDLSRRAESLSIAEFVTLTEWLYAP